MKTGNWLLIFSIILGWYPVLTTLDLKSDHHKKVFDCFLQYMWEYNSTYFCCVYAEEGENTEPKQGILGKNITYEQG